MFHVPMLVLIISICGLICPPLVYLLSFSLSITDTIVTFGINLSLPNPFSYCLPPRPPTPLRNSILYILYLNATLPRRHLLLITGPRHPLRVFSLMSSWSCELGSCTVGTSGYLRCSLDAHLNIVDSETGRTKEEEEEEDVRNMWWHGEEKQEFDQHAGIFARL